MVGDLDKNIHMDINSCIYIYTHTHAHTHTHTHTYTHTYTHTHTHTLIHDLQATQQLHGYV